MPGIVGIFSKKTGKKNEEDLNMMINSMMHESFYTSGTYTNEKLGVYVGWVSHKGSFSDCMPIFNEKKDLVLLFAGENFADKDTMIQIAKKGHDFDYLNASYLIHLYEEKGEAFLSDLNGWFSGVLVDLKQGKVILFNDRYGMGRIYYHENNHEFIFSSEAKSILKVRSQLRRIDNKGLGELFGCGCVLENRSLFRDIFLLPGGSSWAFHNGNKVNKESYFKPDEWENQPVLGKEIYYEKLKDTFLRILPRYFHSKGPIAMSLTGGLDTRMILACRDNAPGTLPCYTFGGIYRDSYDVRVSRKVADECKQEYHVMRLDRKYLSNFKQFAEQTIYISDGCHDVCGSHDLYLNKLAREIAPIRMTGKFGSEVMRSISTFKSVSPTSKLFHPDLNKYVQESEQTLLNLKAGDKVSFAVFKDAPWHEYGRIAVEQSQVTYRTPYMDNDFVKLMYQAPDDVRHRREMSLRVIADRNPNLYDIKTDRGFGGQNSSIASKASQIINWCFFKAEWYYNVGMPHWLSAIDNSIKWSHPEKLIMGRHKIEHYRIWFRDDISGYVREILLDPKTKSRSYVNGGYLEEIVNGHLQFGFNYTNEINKILTVELIHRSLLD